MRETLTGLAILGSILAATPIANAQSGDPNSGPIEIDACGVLVQAGSCVVFQTNGGNYVLADYGRYRAGDSVRVIGTADPDCVQICASADGCIRGATLYDPAQLPCGTDIPSLADDLIPALTESACSALSGSLALIGVIGAALTRRRSREEAMRSLRG